MKTTKQGVRDLGNARPKHEHRHVPEVYKATIRIHGEPRTVERQRMRCVCGDVLEDEQQEKPWQHELRNYYDEF